MRAYEKDSNDTNDQALYVDSDGLVAQPSAFMQSGANSSVISNRTAPVNALDGMWHMITLTSQPSLERGYRCAKGVYGLCQRSMCGQSERPGGLWRICSFRFDVLKLEAQQLWRQCKRKTLDSLSCANICAAPHQIDADPARRKSRIYTSMPRTTMCLRLFPNTRSEDMRVLG